MDVAYQVTIIAIKFQLDFGGLSAQSCGTLFAKLKKKWS